MRGELARAAAGPVICAAVVTGLLSGWAASGGGGSLTRVRLEVTLAAVPMRAFTPQTAARIPVAKTFLTIRNLTGTPDELISASSPIAPRVVLTGRLVVPAHGTVTFSPFGADVVLEHPAVYENSQTVPLTLAFRRAGQVTIQAAVTPPGTP
ncbi:MAG: copper chaperone PCu(A)C [Streptosporangiaceae bacterium]|nr:copper chaperone PCu(A)C [Streptosporangiaceae bacterium]